MELPDGKQATLPQPNLRRGRSVVVKITFEAIAHILRSAIATIRSPLLNRFRLALPSCREFPVYPKPFAQRVHSTIGFLGNDLAW